MIEGEKTRQITQIGNQSRPDWIYLLEMQKDQDGDILPLGESTTRFLGSEAAIFVT